ncbi:MAG: glucosidase [Candidatus Dormibacteraeota bacterium]|nr:glucosidase [Candidatus Dormibacteraeota bacterium]
MSVQSGRELGAEARRLAEVPSGRAPWRHWGPYLSERGWGTVREDYSPDGDAWNFFPHDHARSRSYRWNEDGLAGICDDRQTLCLAFAFWNGRDPILKERLFGLTGPEGNHGEDVKEYWWFLDSTPTHSWLRWRYMYPQAEFPYSQLVSENARRSKQEPELELLDTGAFEADNYWEITVDYAKAAPEEIYVRLTARNHGPAAAELQVLPSLWFRNTWSWSPGAIRPQLRADGSCVLAQHPELGLRRLIGEGDHDLLFCENETNLKRLWGAAPTTPYPKDGINDFVVRGSATVNPGLTGTKAALRYRLNVAAGGTATLRLRLSEGEADFADFEAVMTQREAEADEFYAALTPLRASADEARVMRQGFAGLLWSKQFYHYDVRTWLQGDPGRPPPPASRQNGRNSDWRHLFNQDVISMPDPWEYPWYAAWDLGFHCVTLAHVDAEFAKSQLILLCREWFMHPNGQLPAYEWWFSDVNPPVHAWAALRVFEISGGDDYDFLERIFHKLLLNFTWWVNRKDSEGNNIFEGGFLGLDNIGPFDRSSLPVSGHLEQSDGTAWMAMYCLHLWEIALRLAERDRTYEDMAIKFFEHFVLIAVTLNDKGLWDEVDGFYYDVLRRPDGSSVPLRAHSMVGLIPLYAVTTLGPDTLNRLPSFARAMDWFLSHRPEAAGVVEHMDDPNHAGYRLLAIVGPQSLPRILARVLDPAEFLSDHGVRALSRWHREHPLQVAVDGFQAQLDYEPAESTSGLFGGNSNWRGPVWFPVNYLLIEALKRYHRFLGSEFKVECPTGSGRWLALDQVADELAARLVGLFLSGPDGRRPVFGGYERLQRDPAWQNLLLFHEYFDGDSGAGLGASHQTGWTGLVANLIADRRQLD